MEFPPITQIERRTLGRFDTPRPLAQALTDWAVQDAGATVLEPSCGGGVIVQSVISRLAEIGAKHPDRKIWACDIDPRALNETSRSVAPYAPKLIAGNFLNLSSSAFDDTKFSVILGNPPYVRLHTMDAATRKIARNSLPAPDLLNARASLWAYFPIHAFKLLSVGGRMGWVLPEAILHAEYGKEVLRWATQRFERCIAVSLRERCFAADGAQERVVMLLLSGAGRQASQDVEMVEYATADKCIAALSKLADSHSSPLPRVNGHVVPHLVSDMATIAANMLGTCTDLKRFGDFFDVKIGVVTGNNDFFVLSESKRISAKLNRRHFQRIISKFADLGEGFGFNQGLSEKTDARVWLLHPNPSSVDRRLTNYLRQYTKSEIERNRTMAKRSYWQVPVLEDVPDAFLRYMGKNAPRVVLNHAGYYCTNTIHRVFFNRGLSKAAQRAICLSLHSSYSQLSAEFEGRQYGSGVLKLEPSESKRLVFAFNKPLAEALSSVWPKLSKDAANCGWESVVPKIDEIIVTHCPSLAKSLPLERVRSLLTKVRQRRNSIHLGTGT